VGTEKCLRNHDTVHNILPILDHYHKKIIGRKRNILVDTDELLLGYLVTPAYVGDREAAKSLLRCFWLTLPRLTHIWADGNYDGPLVEWVKHC